MSFHEEGGCVLSDLITGTPKAGTGGKSMTPEHYFQRCISLFPCYSRSTVRRSINANGFESSNSASIYSQVVPQGLLPPLQCIREPNSTSEPISPSNRETLRQLTRVVGGGVTGVVILATEVDCNVPSTALNEKNEGAEVNSVFPLSPFASNSLLSRPRCFVVKLIDLEGDTEIRRNRAAREVQCLQLCNFSFIVRCYRNLVRRQDPDGPADNEKNPIIAMALELEYANNGDLRDEIRSRTKQNKPFPERDALLIFLQILMAVHYLHKKKIIHRDIKAANVFLCSNGIVKLGDFGLSKLIDTGADTAARGSLVGTPYYIAPEVWERKPYCKKADMFSLGVLLYELLTLKRPFHGSNIDEVIHTTINTEVDVDDIQNSNLANLVRLLLSKDPALRPSAGEVLSLPLFRGIFAIFVQRAHKGEERDAWSSGMGSLSHDLKDSYCTRSGQGSPANRNLSREKVHRLLTDLDQVQKEIFQAVVNARPQSDSILQLGDRSFNISRVLIEGVIKKENNKGVWKSRHMSLNWVHAPQSSKSTSSATEGEIEIVFALFKDSPHRVCKSMKSFLDCFAVPECSAPEGTSFVFTLLSKLGNTISFQADTEEEQKKWINAFLDCIEYVRHAEFYDHDLESYTMCSTSLKYQSASTLSGANFLSSTENE